MLYVYAISSGTYNGVHLAIHVIAKMNKLTVNVRSIAKVEI